MIKSRYHIAILICFGLGTFFVSLSSEHPDIMEARNFISVREMISNGNWLIPTLNEEVRIRKPPVPIWLTAISALAFDDTDNLFALRTPAVIIGILMVIFLYLLLIEMDLSKHTAFLSASVLATCYLFIEISRTGSWDIYCHGFMVGAMLFLVKAFKQNRLSLHYLFAGIFFALSFNSKGPVAFYAMLLPFLMVYISLFRKTEIKVNYPGLVIMLIITVILCTAWPIYIYIKIPEIANQIAVEEASAWVDRHNRPIWFYLHFPLFTGPWCLLVIGVLFRPFKASGYIARKQIVLIFLWFIAAFVLLSIIPEKKERYFLPALVPLATLLGCSFESQIKLASENGNAFLRRLTLLQRVLMLLLCPGIIVFFYLFGYAKDNNIFMFSLFALGAVFFMIIFIWSWVRQNIQMFYYFCFLFVITYIGILLSYIPNISAKNEHYQNLTILRDDPHLGDLPFYTNDETMNPIQIWEAGKPVKQWAYYMGEKSYILITKMKLPVNQSAAELVSIVHYHPKQTEETYFIYNYSK